MTIAGIIRRSALIVLLPCLVACPGIMEGPQMDSIAPDLDPAAPSKNGWKDGAAAPAEADSGKEFPPNTPDSAAAKPKLDKGVLDKGVLDKGTPAKPDQGKASFPPVAGCNYATKGPYGSTTMNKVGPNKSFTVFRPKVLGQAGVRHPFITWGNGTGAVPSIYAGLLSHWATHGFVVIASNSTQTGNGKELVKGIDWLVSENKRAGSIFYNKLDPSAIGASGHSQGGCGCVNAANDPRVKCAAPLMPGPGNAKGVKGPMFVVTGSADFIVPHFLVKMTVYNPSPVPTCLAKLQGATHFAACGSAKAMSGYLTSWFRLCLMGESPCKKLFYGTGCDICKDKKWTVERKKM